MCRDGANDDARAGMAQTTGPDDEMCRDGAETIGRSLSKSSNRAVRRDGADDKSRRHLCRDGADDAEECAVMAQWRRRRNIRRRVCRDGADDADTDDECAVTAQATRRSAP